jgi:hypothetical protein
MNERIATPTAVVLDKPRSFLLTFRAIRKIKTWTGKNLLDPGCNPLAQADLDGILAVVAGLLLHEDPAMTPDRAEELIDKAAGITYVMAQIKAALGEYADRGTPPKETPAAEPDPTIAPA